MYQFKQEKIQEVQKYEINKLANKVGITRVYLSYIIHNKYNCRKPIAQSITNILDKTKEIKYYFNIT